MQEYRLFAHEYSETSGFSDLRYFVLVRENPSDEGFSIDEIHSVDEERLVDGSLYEVNTVLDGPAKDVPKYFKLNINTRSVEKIDEKIIEGFNKL